MSRVLGVITARGGSRGIPRKNLVDVAGKPLIAHSIDAALGSRLLDRVILSTDDEEIAGVGRRHGVDVPFLRPAHLAADGTPSVPVLLHALAHLESVDGYRPAAVMLLQPTSPLRTSAHIDEAIELFREQGADSVVSVSEPLEHPCEMVQVSEGRMTFALPGVEGAAGRQQYPEFFFLNGAILLVTREVLARAEHPWGGKIVAFPMSPLDSIDIDSTAHLTLADLLLRQRSVRAQ